MKEILFITSNENKLKEVREIIGGEFNILSLKDIGWDDEIPEPFDSIEENAIYKAHYFFEKTQKTCMAEDSGLEVEALNGEPGAMSARYAGPERNNENNIQKVLEKLDREKNRNARFLSVISYKTPREIYTFEGEMKGTIVSSPRGKNGFGYDPIFQPLNSQKTNAELTAEEKNNISHRRKALDKFSRFLLKE